MLCYVANTPHVCGMWDAILRIARFLGKLFRTILAKWVNVALHSHTSWRVSHSHSYSETWIFSRAFGLVIRRVRRTRTFRSTCTNTDNGNRTKTAAYQNSTHTARDTTSHNKRIECKQGNDTVDMWNQKKCTHTHTCAPSNNDNSGFVNTAIANIGKPKCLRMPGTWNLGTLEPWETKADRRLRN